MKKIFILSSFIIVSCSKSIVLSDGTIVTKKELKKTKNEFIESVGKYRFDELFEVPVSINFELTYNNIEPLDSGYLKVRDDSVSFYDYEGNFIGKMVPPHNIEDGDTVFIYNEKNIVDTLFY